MTRQGADSGSSAHSSAPAKSSYYCWIGFDRALMKPKVLCQGNLILNHGRKPATVFDAAVSVTNPIGTKSHFDLS